MQSIKEILSEVFKDLSKAHPPDKDIAQAWKSAAGSDSTKTDIVQWKEGVLKIHVDSSARMFKLNLKKSQLIKEIKKDIETIEEIIFKVGKISKSQ